MKIETYEKSTIEISRNNDMIDVIPFKRGIIIKCVFQVLSFKKTKSVRG